MKTRAKNTLTRRPAALLGTLLTAAVLLGIAPASAMAAAQLGLSLTHQPTEVTSGYRATYTLAVSNPGDAATSTATITVGFTLPAGLRATAVSDQIRSPDVPGAWTCSIAGDSQSVSCTGPSLAAGRSIPAGEEACVTKLTRTCRIIVSVRADSGLSPGTLTPTAQACGGGVATCADASGPTEVVSPPPFGLSLFDGGAFDSLGEPVNQAGAHPHAAVAEIAFDTLVTGGDPSEIPSEDVRDILTTLPPGFIGNPQAVPACSAADFVTLNGGESSCPVESQIGINTLVLGAPDAAPDSSAVHNLVPAPGEAAKLGFVYAGVPVTLTATLSPTPPYTAVVRASNISQIVPLFETRFRVWGVPASSAHDGPIGADGRGGPSSAEELPFLSLPTSCMGPVRTDLEVTSWKGSTDSASFLSHDNLGGPLGIEGCDVLDFSPTLQARPTTNVADSPSGLEVDLGVPQNQDPSGKATAHLRDTTVTLPEGLVVNPSGANGLGACSPSQVNLDGPEPARCPDDSKLGTVEVNTPLLDHPVEGAVHIATPFDNPFNSLLALYITLEDPQTSTVVKLAGEVTPDPETGQLSSTFTENPQVPFEHFRLHFKSGPHGSLRTPATCGDYTTTSELTPWSAPHTGLPDTPSDTWSIDQGPGGSCANSPGEQPHAPSFDAGTVSPIAASHSPFVVHLRREDGSQNFSSVTLTPPQGLVAKLAGTAICPDSSLAAAAAKSGAEERANPSCPAASEVGSVSASAGAGPAPYHAPGVAYLAGPHRGAPLSFAIVTPATAGPFDLGTIVVKTAIYVNAKTAEITAVSDPIPAILQGIPLDVRTVDVSLDRPNFALNPTSCDPMAVSGQLLSTIGQLASLSSRFQLAECTRLGFKPQMTLTLRGGTKRGAHPALTIALRPRPGDANIASFSLALPRSEFLENAHIRTICTRPDFAADRCPAGAIYGEASVTTPLLDYPLTGHVYLRSSDNLLPDVVPDLRGPAYQPIRLETSGRTDSIRGGIRNTLDFIPDAPFTEALVQLQGGNKGLLVNSRDICARTYRATVRYEAHNGLTHVASPKMRAKCGRGRKGKRGGYKRDKRAALAQSARGTR